MNENIKEILSNAFRISTDITFNVGFQTDNGFTYKTMTYLELGIYLTTKHDNIIKINIISIKKFQ